VAGYDVAVIGLGAMGAAAIHTLARRGVRAIGFDRFEPAHHRGSSFGESRVIRLAYFEHPDYVPLLRRAYAAWRELEAATGERVLSVTGIVEAGAPGAPLVENSLQSARLHGLDHAVLTPRQVNDRFPAFDIPAGWSCLFQPDAGALFPEKAIRLFVAGAAALGAEVRCDTEVREVRPVDGRVAVRLADGETVEAGAAIVSAGAWIGDLVPALGRRLRLTRQPLLWFEPRDRALTQPDRMPIFFLQPPGELVYGLPDLVGSGVKAASHLDGGALASADEPRRDVSAEEAAQVRGVLQRYVPAAAGPVRQTSLCIYTRTADEHFVLGPHPEAPQIVLASPCSGHGFKFASVVGEALADLAVKGDTALPIGLFDPRRVLDA
jgi:sarcosine oxidase